jgi:WD40 repeat protein
MTVDHVLKAFEAAWRAGKAPTLADFVPPDATGRDALLLELVHLDLEFRLKQGEVVRVEHYLEAYPELAASPDDVLDLLLAECRLRGRTEPGLGLDEYLSRFPQYADDLPDHFRGPATLKHQSAPVDGVPLRGGARPSARRPSPPGCEILREIGRGGMGVVYLARQTALNRLVAVKMIHPVLHGDEPERRRFRTEVLAAARLRHPNIVSLYEVGEVEGQPYYVFEYLEGGSLADRLKGVPLPAAQAAALVEPLARAMHYAHEQGVVHRDLKPENVLLAACDFAAGAQPQADELLPKIADFGLAKFLEDHPERTRSGVILGTACYMAPEQASGHPSAVGPAADIYALGAVLYELLSGKPPFQGATVLCTLEQVRGTEPVALSQLQPGTPRDIETICLQCLRKEAGRRYATAAALADDLRRFLDGRPVVARPTPWWERAGKWGRRQPLTAAALTAFVLALVLGITGIAWQWRLALRRETDARTAQEAEQWQRREAVRRLYFNQIARAQQAWLSGRAREAERLLQDCQADTPDLCRWEWDYLKGLSQDSLRTLTGHQTEVRGLLVTPDGKWLISASGVWRGDEPGKIIVRDSTTGAGARELPGVGPGVHYLALHPGGKRLAAAGYDGLVRLWDLDDPGRAPTALPHGQGNTVFCVAFSPAGDRLLAACLDHAVYVWDMDDLRQPRRLTGHGDNVFSVAFSPDGKWLASGARDGTVILRDGATLQRRRTFDGLGDARVVTFSPDSRRLAVGTFPGLVRVWDLHDEKAPAWTLAPDAGYITDLAFSPDGQYLAWSTAAKGARVVDLADGTTAQEFRGHDSGVLRVAFSPDMHCLFTGGGDGEVRQWDLTMPDEPRDFRAHHGFIYQLAFSPDGQYLALPGGYNQTHILERSARRCLIRRAVADDEPPLHFDGHDGWLTCVAYRPDGRQIATGADDNTVRLWDAMTGTPQRTLRAHDAAVTGVAYSADGRVLLTAGEDCRVRIWDPDSGTLLRTLGEHAGPVVALGSSPAGPYAASGSTDGSVRLWDVEQSGIVREIHCPTDAGAAGLAFGPGGTVLACAYDDWTIRVYETATGRELTPADRPLRMATRGAAEVGRNTPGVRRRISLAFHPDGQRLVSAAPNCPLQLWDVAGSQEALALPHVSSAFLAAAFSPDGRRLAASHGSLVALWDAHPRRDGLEPAAADPNQSARDWHESLSRKAEAAHDWFALEFHCDRLVALQCQRAIHGYRLASARLALGDGAGHSRACAELLRRFATTATGEDAYAVASACVIDPAAGGDARALVDVAMRAVRAYPEREWLLGAALYRAGNFDEAARRFENAARQYPRGRPAWEWLFLALIRQGQGDATGARLSYVAANLRLLGERPSEWMERFEVQALKREAERLLHIEPRP